MHRQDRKPWFAFGFLLILIAIIYGIEVDLGHFQLNVLSEPFIALLGIWLLIDMDWQKLWNSAFLKHPLTILIGIYFLWIVLTLPFSVQALVSIKYGIVGIAHCWLFYFGIWHLSEKYAVSLFQKVFFYALAMLPVIGYAWYTHSIYDFRVDAAILTARPFFKDNTLYAICLSMLFLPIGISALHVRSRLRWGLLIVGGILGVALYLTFCRAAWLSIFLTICLVATMWFFKLDFKKIISLSILGGLAFFLLFPLLKTEAISKKGGAWQQIKSITNLTNDVSNLERLNRYKCAWRMFKKRPITGFGAGAYPSAYLPFQKESEMTRLSVRTLRRADGTVHHSGRGGSTHSEYLRALSELGIIGFISWIGFFLGSLFYGMKLFHESEGKKKQQALLILLGLLPFFIHVLFNNFYQQEEVAILFWALLSSLVVLDTTKVKA